MGDTIIAWQRAGFKAMIPGDGFDSEIFTIVVGPDAKTYTAHAVFLSQSPVLKRMCHAGFQESQTRRISLPEDDSRVIRSMIQYLYGGDFFSFGTKEVPTEESTKSADSLIQAAEELAAIYVTADKYQLQDLKTLLVGKLTCLIDIYQQPIEFLQMARKVYARISDYEDIFRTFFKETAAKLPMQDEMDAELGNVFKECISDGGIMAIDLFAALCSKSTDAIKAEKQRGETALQTTTSLLVALRKHHTEVHLNSRHCYVTI
ncbi:MAG: hypothetical protein Q9218_004676 [Villophora microphyllina]